jgi:ABC-type antimicrobial peptide transport system permease subunit
MVLKPEDTWNIMMRIEAGREKEVIYQVRKFYKSFNPGFTFEFDFLDEEYASLYSAEQRVGTLSRYFAGFAIIISCLGLFGLAAFTVERRIKEIGIRKTLGSSSIHIVYLLSKDFTRLVFVSVIIALPLGYILVNNWMEQFVFKTELSAWVFIGAGLTELFIAWLTISTQAIRAASINPVECLRDE